MVDIIAAIVEVLKADAGVAALCGTRVFGGELPDAETPDMPRAALVIQPSGGVPFQAESYIEADAQRIDLIAYGETPRVADQLRSAGRQCLVSVRREVSAGVLIHWVQSAGGFTVGRDRDGQWPYAFQSFQVLYATPEVS